MKSTPRCGCAPLARSEAHTMAQPQASAGCKLIAFPRAVLHNLLGETMKRHRLPESLAQALVREAANFGEAGIDGALALALGRRLKPQPVDLEKARGILLVGPAGSGKSAVAAKIHRAATLIGRKTELAQIGRASCR